MRRTPGRARWTADEASVAQLSELGPEIRQNVAGFADPSAWYRHEITRVTTARDDPRVVSGGVFEGGHLRGRIFVLDYQTGQIACAAEVRADLGATEEVLDGFQEGSLRANLSFEYRELALEGIGVQDR